MFRPVMGMYLPSNADLPTHALRPVDMQVKIEPVSGDRIFVFLFNEQAPLAIRFTQEDILHSRILLARAEAEALH